MSFGYSAGDFIAIGQLTWTVYKSCKRAPGEFQELARELSSLHTILHELEDEAKTPTSLLNRRGVRRKPELEALLENLSATINKVEDIVKRYHSLGRDQKKTWDRVKFATKDLADLRSKLQLHITGINLFISSLSAGSLARIEGLLDELVRDIREGRKEPTIVSTYEDNDELAWDELERELVGDGITREDVRCYREEIRDYLRRLVEDNADTIGPFDSVSCDGDSGYSTPNHDGPAIYKTSSSVESATLHSFPVDNTAPSESPGHGTSNYGETHLPSVGISNPDRAQHIPSVEAFMTARAKFLRPTDSPADLSTFSLAERKAIVIMATESLHEIGSLGLGQWEYPVQVKAKAFATKLAFNREGFDYQAPPYHKLGRAIKDHETLSWSAGSLAFLSSYSNEYLLALYICEALADLKLECIEIPGGFRCLWLDKRTEFFVLIVKLPLVERYVPIFQDISRQKLDSSLVGQEITRRVSTEIKVQSRQGL